MMDRVAQEVERDPYYGNIMYAQRAEPDATAADAISAATRQIAETLNLANIVCYTSSGTTGLRAARERPQTPIITMSRSSPLRVVCLWSGGACIALFLKIQVLWTKWSIVPAARLIRKDLPNPVNASLSLLASHWVHREPPTCFALPLLAATDWAASNRGM